MAWVRMMEETYCCRSNLGRLPLRVVGIRHSIADRNHRAIADVLGHHGLQASF